MDTISLDLPTPVELTDPADEFENLRRILAQPTTDPPAQPADAESAPQNEFEAARAERERIEKELADLPGRIAAAARSGDAGRVTILRRRQAEASDELFTARVTEARVEAVWYRELQREAENDAATLRPALTAAEEWTRRAFEAKTAAQSALSDATMRATDYRGYANAAERKLEAILSADQRQRVDRALRQSVGSA